MWNKWLLRLKWLRKCVRAKKFVFYPIIKKLFKKPLASKNGQDASASVCGGFSAWVRDCLSKRHMFDVWCGLQSKGVVEVLLLTLPAYCRKQGCVSLRNHRHQGFIRLDIQSAWNKGTDCERHSVPAEEFHFALLCGDTQHSCVLNPYQSTFPYPYFIWKKPLKSILCDADVSLDLLITQVALWLKDKPVWWGHLWAFGLSK